jgi:WD40 repeat protein
LAVFAFVERNDARRQARDATSRALAAEATARLDSDPAVSVALALEGTRVADTPQAARALRAAVVESRLRRVLAEPKGPVDAVAFSPRGDRIVSTEMTGARIWDASTGRLLTSFFDATYQPHKQIAFADGGETIMVAPDPQAEACLGTCSDRTVRLWRADQPEPRNLTHSDSATVAAFVTRNRIVTGAGDGIVRLWSADEHPHVVSELGKARGSPVTPYSNRDGDTVVTVAGNGSAEIWRLEPRAKRVFRLPPVRIGQDGYKRVGAITDDGSYAAVAREEGVVALIRLGKRPHVVARLTGHTHPVSSIAFDDAGERVATAAGTGYFFSFDPQALVWSTRDGSRIASLGGHTGPVTGVSFAPHTGVILTTSGDGYGRVWAPDGRLLSVLRGHTKDITSASFAPDGRTIATGSEDGTIRIWDAGIGTRPQRAGVSSLSGVSALSPDRTRLALDEGSKSVVWDLATGKLTNLKGSHPASSIAFDAAGRRVIVGSLGGARVFDAEGLPLTPFLRGNAKEGEVTSAALSPDGRWAVTAGTNQFFDGGDRIILWRLSNRSATQVRKLAEGEKENEVSSFSPDGRWLVAEEYIDHSVWDISNKKKVEAPVEGMLSLPAVFSRDGKIAVMPMGPTVWRVGLWRKPVCEGDDFAAVSAIALSGDARTIATGGFRGELLLRNARTCKIEAALDQAGTGIDAVDLSPDNRFLLSAAGSLVRVTDVQTKDDVAVYVVPGVVSAGFGADPTQIWTTSARGEGGDGEAQIFRCIPCGSLDDVRREAERLERIRPLKKSELDQYVKGD